MELPKSTETSVIATQTEVIMPNTLPKEIVDKLNNTLADEYAAHYFYRKAHNWCANVNYKKAAAYFEQEATDELAHAEMLQKYLVDWNATPVLPSIKFNGDFSSLIDVINKAYVIEFNLGEKYNDVSAKIFTQHLPTFDFLKKFRKIQTISIAEYSDLLNAAQLIDVSSKLDLLYFEERYF
jgi:ferritin